MVLTFSDVRDPRDSNAFVRFGRKLETVAGACTRPVKVANRDVRVWHGATENGPS